MSEVKTLEQSEREAAELREQLALVERGLADLNDGCVELEKELEIWKRIATRVGAACMATADELNTAKEDRDGLKAELATERGVVIATKAQAALWSGAVGVAVKERDAIRIESVALRGAIAQLRDYFEIMAKNETGPLGASAKADAYGHAAEMCAATLDDPTVAPALPIDKVPAASLIDHQGPINESEGGEGWVPSNEMKGTRVRVVDESSNNFGAIGHIDERDRNDREYEWRVAFDETWRDNHDVWFATGHLRSDCGHVGGVENTACVLPPGHLGSHQHRNTFGYPQPAANPVEPPKAAPSEVERSNVLFAGLPNWLDDMREATGNMSPHLPPHVAVAHLIAFSEAALAFMNTLHEHLRETKEGSP